MQLGLNDLGLNNGQVFSPAAFFSASEQGAWYDPSDLSSMFQESTGVTPAVVGQPVGLILDKSGRGNHATQATAAARPTLRQAAGGQYYLEFDGVDDSLVGALPSGDYIYHTLGSAAAMRSVADDFKQLVALGNIGNATPRLRNYPISSLWNTLMTNDAGSSASLESVTAADTSAHVHLHNSGASSRRYRVDSVVATAAAASGAMTINAIGLGAKLDGGAGDYGQLNLYQTVLVAAVITSAQEASLAAYLAVKGGVTL